MKLQSIFLLSSYSYSEYREEESSVAVADTCELLIEYCKEYLPGSKLILDEKEHSNCTEMHLFITETTVVKNDIPVVAKSLPKPTGSLFCSDLSYLKLKYSGYNCHYQYSTDVITLVSNKWYRRDKVLNFRRAPGNLDAINKTREFIMTPHCEAYLEELKRVFSSKD